MFQFVCVAQVVSLSDVLDSVCFPSKISSGFELLPILGVGGKEASMNGMESSSYRGDLLLRLSR